MIRKMLRAGWPLVLSLVLGGAAPAATPAAPDPLPAPPEGLRLQSGELPNGFRYSILRRTAEPGRISLRLIVHAGSIDEHEDERGYAHFVEHMAFNGSRHYPPGQLVPFFQRHGMTWGADVNADTSFTRTLYKLDLPAGHGADLGEALQILRDYADGVEFIPSEVRRERKVILSEISARNTIDYQMAIQRVGKLYAGTPLPARLPLGDSELVRRATAGALRLFYQRCYRPVRMELVAVGDVAPGSLTKLISQDFADMKGTGPGSAPVVAGALPAAGLSAHVVANSLVHGGGVALVAIAPFDGSGRASIENHVGASVVIAILDRRLAARRAAASPKFGHVGASMITDIDSRYIQYAVEASTVQDDWVPAVVMVENELRRAREQGFDASEVRESVAAAVADLRSQAATAGGATPDQLADLISIALAADRQWLDPATVLAIADPYLRQFTPERAAATLRSILPDPGLHLKLTVKQAAAGEEHALLAAYEASAAKPLAAADPKTAGDLNFRYTDFGPLGAVAGRRREPDLGLEEVTFANGVALNLRPSGFEPHRFHLSARIGRGVADAPPDKPGMYLLGLAYWSRCDLGRHTREEMHRFIELHAIVGDLTFADGECGLELSGPSEELRFAFQLLAASLSDAKFDPSKMPQAVSFYSEVISQILSSGKGLVQVDGGYYMTGSDPRFRIPGPSEIGRYSFDEVAGWMRTRILGGPLEIGVAGDIDAEAAVAAAASSIGTLARRGDPTVAEGERIHFLARPWRQLSFVNMPDQSAAVRLLWPVRDGADVHAYRALQVGTAALQENLRVTLRQELGVTYSPIGVVYRNREQPDFGFVAVDLSFPPKDAGKLAERSVKLANRLSQRGLSKDEFSRAIEPLRSEAAAYLRSNEWWLWNVLILAQSRPAVLDEARSLPTAFDRITLHEVNQALAAHFKPAYWSAVVDVPRTASAGKN